MDALRRGQLCALVPVQGNQYGWLKSPPSHHHKTIQFSHNNVQLAIKCAAKEITTAPQEPTLKLSHKRFHQGLLYNYVSNSPPLSQTTFNCRVRAFNYLIHSRRQCNAKTAFISARLQWIANTINANLQQQLPWRCFSLDDVHKTICINDKQQQKSRHGK